MDVSAKFEPGSDITCRANAAVIGGRVVIIAAAAEADDKFNVANGNTAAALFGVAMRDKAEGDDVLVKTGGILPIEVGATPIAAGVRAAVDAAGRVVPVGTGGSAGDVGLCVRGAAAAAFALIDFDV